MNPTNWVPGLIVLAVGVAMALLFLLAGRKRPAGPARDPKLADLDQRVQILLDQLRELDVERHELGGAYVAEKARLEAAAAAALKERDLRAHARPRASLAAPAVDRADDAGRAPPFFARHPQLKGAAWGAGVVLFFVAVAFVLTREQRDRGAGEITGAAPPGAASMPRQSEADREFERAVASAKEDPTDLERASFVSHELLRELRYDEAAEITRRALAASPFHVELRIHHAVLRGTGGDVQSAMQELERLARYPEAYEALLFRGALAMQVGSSAVALESFERYVAEAPPEMHPPQLATAIALLRGKLNVSEK
jgi:tetratricopeptide (TPR) repeat protein